MAKCVTEKQRLANRRNAARSTGPTTPAGKARSSRNALKHGLLTRDVVLHHPDAHESQKDFDAFLADLRVELEPRNLIEQTLVERIATCFWRLRRVQRFEVGALRGLLETPDAFRAEIDKLRKDLHDARHDQALEKRLAELLDKPADRLTPDEAAELEHSLADFGRVSGLAILKLDRAATEQKARDLVPDVLRRCRLRIDQLQTALSAAEQRSAVHRSHAAHLANLPERDALQRVVRYETMLDRQIHRAIAELQRRRVTRRDTIQKKSSGTKP